MAEAGEGEFRYTVPYSARVTDVVIVRADDADEAQDAAHRYVSTINPEVPWLDLEIGKPVLMEDWEPPEL